MLAMNLRNIGSKRFKTKLLYRQINIRSNVSQLLNKKRRRLAIFSVNGVQRGLFEHTPNQFQRKTEF